jgi:hypothetical protein
MNGIGINLNASCEVVLTEVGAARLNQIDEELYSNCPRLKRTLPYIAGATYRSQIWCLFRDFGPIVGIGLAVPFERCRITVEADA